jgi:cytochrome c oxidase cbb3-type subunit I/II
MRWAILVVALAVIAPAWAGDALYERECAFCHGIDGRGDGPAATHLRAPPADFSAGNFKLRSTPSGMMPTDDDLLGSITRGIPGSGMPSFAALTLEERRALVRVVKELSRPREGGEGYFVTRPNGPVVPVPRRPRSSAALLAKGAKLYRELACASCHGDEGRGDGRSAPELKDYAGRPLPPTNFTLGVFKGGADPRQLYLRLATGMNGTPMAEYGDDVLRSDDRWALVDYLLALVGR